MFSKKLARKVAVLILLTMAFYVIPIVRSSLPRAQASVQEMQVIAAEEESSLALSKDGTVWSWGYNFHGELGDGTTTERHTPVQVKGLTGIEAITGGWANGLALQDDGSVWSWGNNDRGQLGYYTPPVYYHSYPYYFSSTPAKVQGISDVVAIAAGGDHNLILKKDGTVWAWGDNSHGEVGNGVFGGTVRTPTRVSGLTGVVKIAAGAYHSLAIKSDGTVWAWGSNVAGQLGNGTWNSSAVPVQVPGLTGVVSISGGMYQSLALKNDGTVWEWGYDVGSKDWSSYLLTPVKVNNLKGVVAISAGDYHNLVVRNDGTVWGWGDNPEGNLGDGTTNFYSVPVQAKGIGNVTAVSARYEASLALTNDGTVWGWGDNWYGKLGNGTYANNFQLPVKSLFTSGMTGTTATAISGSDAVQAIAQQDPNLVDSNSLVSDPVDSATGSHTIRQTLLEISGTPPIPFSVEYNSLLLSQGPLGRGWGHNFETSLDALANGNVKIHWTANRTNTFSNIGNNHFTSTEWATRYDNLTKNSDGSYTLIRKDQSVYLFNSSGELTEQKNAHGQALLLSYNSQGRLLTVTDPLSKQALNFSYSTQGLIDKVSDNANRQVSFRYDASSNLTGIIDPLGKTTSFTYNVDGRIVTATDPEGNLIFADTYDDKGRIVTQHDGISTHQDTQFSYDEQSQPGKVITTVIGRNGETRVLTHNSKYQLLSIKDELGNTTSYTYDEDGNRTGQTDSAGNKTSYVFDSQGNLITITDPLGRSTVMTYDNRNNLLTVENPDGKKAVYAYDTNNNLTSYTDAVGKTTSYNYDANGLLLSETTPGSGVTQYSYLNGLLTEVTDPNGNCTTYGYDLSARPVSITDAEGKITNLTFDAADNITSITDPLGNKTSFSYDSHHHVLTKEDAKGNITNYAYNGNGKLISMVDPLNNETSYTYDGDDHLIKVVNALGNATGFSYDAKGRLTGVIDPIGNKTTVQYDSLDNIIGITDALGNSLLSATFDPMNDPLTLKDALGNTVTNQYDSLDRLDQSTDPMGRVTKYGYDDLNRLTSALDPMGGTSRQEFDADGNRTAVVDPNNNQTSLSYDNAGNLTAETTAYGNVTKYGYNALNLLDSIANARDQVTNLKYDADGRLVSYIDTDGKVTLTYDANGNVLTTKDKYGTILRAYDALNRVTKYTDAEGNTISYAYDALGNLVTLTYPGGKQVHYGYDAANRMASVTDWAGRVTSYGYDADSRLVKTTQADGTIVTNSYDASGRLTGQKDTDKNGNVISQYDNEYDAAGNIVQEAKSVIPSSLGRMGQKGRQDKTKLANGVTDKYIYDGNNRLTQAKVLDKSGKAIYEYDYTYDPAGNIIEKTSNLAEQEDGLAKIGQERTETAENSTQQTIMTYTKDNRLATYNGKTIKYDADSNLTKGPLGKEMAKFNYDSQNKLTKAGNTTYVYDAENNRIGVKQGEHKTSYVVNPNAPLSQVLIEKQNKEKLTYYVYGMGLIGQENGQGDYRTYHFDLRGSTTALTDFQERVTDSYQYDPYGKLIKKSGPLSTPFLYNGKFGVTTDKNGLIYMRSRYYDPNTSRFISRDIVQGTIKISQSLNHYAFLNGNPVSFIDPLGLSPMDSGPLTGARWQGEDHYLVQQYILNNRPSEFQNYTSLALEVFIPNGGTFGINGRADIVDLETKQIWEVKPVSVTFFPKAAENADAQLERYISNYPGGGARLGEEIAQFSFHKNDYIDIGVQSFRGHQGILYYWERTRKPLQPSQVPSVVPAATGAAVAGALAWLLQQGENIVQQLAPVL